MSIRSNALGVRGDLAPELQDILRRNGMQAHIIRQGDAYQLAVQGHDSPLLSYPINIMQMRALGDWGANSANKKAYSTFTDIVGNDFHLPKNFVHARNANGRVAMGLHGYRIGVGEYGRLPMDRRGMHPMMDPWQGRYLGWTARQQDGYHMRRVGGQLFMQDAPMVPERTDGRLKPGELQSGGYGFYYKGQSSQAVVNHPQQDVLEDLQTVITPVEVRPRAKEPAVPYNELITSKVYFTNEKWQECLKTHGILIDAEKRMLTIQSSASKQDLLFDLTDEEVKALTNNSVKEVPVDKRLDVLNAVIKDDFADPITMDILNSKEQIGIKLTPTVEAELNARQQQVMEQANVPIVMDGQHIEMQRANNEPEDRNVAHVDGNALYEINEGKGWFREGRHGREVMVDDIKVEPVMNDNGNENGNENGNQKGKGEAKYRMTAVINGEAISHEITQKQYDKFMAVDDYHRMKLFSHIFKEVDMKNVPGQHSNVSAKIGGALLAGLSMMGEMGRGMRGAPSVFMEHHESRGHPDSGPHVYFKAGVDSPQELAARAFDAGVNAGVHGVGIHH